MVVRDKVNHGVYGYLAEYETDTHKAVGYINEAYHMEIFNRVALALLSAGVPSLDGKSVLDIGAGSGQIAPFLIEKMGMKPEGYTGVERVEALIARQAATEPVKNDKGEVVEPAKPLFSIIADKFPTEKLAGKMFDVVLLVGTCATYPAPWDLIRDAEKSVAEGGVLVVTMLDTDKYDGQFHAQPVEKMCQIAKMIGDSFTFSGGRECVLVIRKKQATA